MAAVGKIPLFLFNIETKQINCLADVGDPYLVWKQQMDKWQNEYITDWQYHFEQYKR